MDPEAVTCLQVRHPGYGQGFPRSGHPYFYPGPGKIESRGTSPKETRAGEYERKLQRLNSTKHALNCRRLCRVSGVYHLSTIRRLSIEMVVMPEPRPNETVLWVAACLRTGASIALFDQQGDVPVRARNQQPGAIDLQTRDLHRGHGNGAKVQVRLEQLKETALPVVSFSRS